MYNGRTMGSCAEVKPGTQSLEAAIANFVEARRTTARAIRSILKEMAQGIVEKVVIEQWENPLVGTLQISYGPSTNSLIDEKLGPCKVLAEERRQILTPENHPDIWIMYGNKIAEKLTVSKISAAT